MGRLVAAHGPRRPLELPENPVPEIAVERVEPVPLDEHEERREQLKNRRREVQAVVPNGGAEQLDESVEAPPPIDELEEEERALPKEGVAQVHRPLNPLLDE